MKKLTAHDIISHDINVRREEKKRNKQSTNENFKEKNPVVMQSRIEKLERFTRAYTHNWAPVKVEVEIQIPKIFSMYKKPKECLKVIYKIASLKDVPGLKSLKIDHSNCQTHDLSAEVLLAHTVVALKSYRTKDGGKLRISGLFPTQEKMKRLMRSIGIVKETSNPKYHVSENDKLRLFRRRSDINEETNIFGKDKKTRATEDFAGHINRCLSHINAKLDADEVKKLHKYLGEVLGNAEEHSDTRIWDIVSYLDAQENNKNLEIVIYSVGNTIFENFLNKKNVRLIFDKLENYVKKHNNMLDDECLTMIHALQQNISSKKDEDVTRGQGTKYLIDLFHHFSQECQRIRLKRGNDSPASKPKMFIISGAGMLKFDGTYDPLISEKEKMVYAFNSNNDLEECPDINYVKNMGEVTFPGAIIYIKLPLDGMSNLVEIEDDN